MKIIMILLLVIGLAMFGLPGAAIADETQAEAIVAVDQEEEQEEEYQYEFEEQEEEEEEDLDDEDYTPDNLKYFKEMYELPVTNNFEEVFAAIKKVLTEDYSCMLEKEVFKTTDNGMYKGIIKSDMCVFEDNEDSVLVRLERLAVKIPFIRGGIWSVARMQYKFVITENEDASCHIRLKGELSANERYVTQRVHVFQSNGILETRMIEKLATILNVKK